MLQKCLFCFVFLFSLLTSLAFARDLSEREQNALSYMRELCFEITRYNVTGLSSRPESVALASISKIGSSLLTQRKFTVSAKNPVYLCEYYFPEKLGIIDATFCPEDLYAANDFFSGIENVGAGEESEEELPNFDWIDLLLQGMNAQSVETASTSEEYGMFDGEKLLEMLEKGDSRGIEAQDEGKTEENLPQEATYSKNDGSLRRFSYDGEQFTAWRDGENTVLVNFYGDRLIRKTFDPLYRLVKNERFKTGTSAKNMSLESELDFTYAGDSSQPESTLEEQIATKKRTENHFDENGRVISLLESHYEEREVKSKKKTPEKEGEKERVLVNDKKTIRGYDESGRIIAEEITTWAYKTNSFGRLVTEERTVKNVYDYSAVTEENNLPPNVQFFENGELHLERNYTGASDYSEKLYFEGGFSVEVRYENGMKKSEIIYLNDVEQRRREFEY